MPRHPTRCAVTKALVRTGFLLLTLTVTAAIANAQAAGVFGPADLDEMPAFASPNAAAKIIGDSYPAAMRRLGVTGLVQVRFVVGENGQVEEGSIEVMSASAPQLGVAAKQAVQRIVFRPGHISGRAVRSLVLLPIVYR